MGFVEFKHALNMDSIVDFNIIYQYIVQQRAKKLIYLTHKDQLQFVIISFNEDKIT